MNYDKMRINNQNTDKMIQLWWIWKVINNPSQNIIDNFLMKNSPDNFWVIALKPHTFPIDFNWYQIQNFLHKMITDKWLTVFWVSEKQLEINEILELYTDIYQNNEWSNVILDQIRIDLMEYMTSWTIFSYLLHWYDSQMYANEIKKIFRVFHKTIQSKPFDVKNFIHVPDNHELKKNIEILFYS